MRRRGRDRYRPAQARNLAARSPFYGIDRGPLPERWTWTAKSPREILDDLIWIASFGFGIPKPRRAPEASRGEP
jgi:hypothetical protein